MSSLSTGVVETCSSSERLVQFLEEANLHKKDFAEMIGVTLSYVYSLIDQSVPFSTRTTTLERIAVVMGTSPDTFPEYRRAEDPRIVDLGIEFFRKRQQEIALSNVALLKRFPRNRRLEVVDMWRGALPMPLDWSQLSAIGDILGLTTKDIYPYWQERLQQHLTAGGIEPASNQALLAAMFQGAKAQLGI
ncbi:MAG: helix-turn-helix transcriptional regulator [Candidatus Melainabacteria bacterium]|nr:helix-turn-helix transcriptional regulator [Candidatus Melainabacteria bacterium]